VELGLLLRRKPAEDDGLETGVGVLGDRLQTRLDHDLERTAAAKDAGREDAEAHALQLVLAGPLHRVLVASTTCLCQLRHRLATLGITYVTPT
jgi:hypothetical protein